VYNYTVCAHGVKYFLECASNTRLTITDRARLTIKNMKLINTSTMKVVCTSYAGMTKNDHTNVAMISPNPTSMNFSIKLCLRDCFSSMSRIHILRITRPLMVLTKNIISDTSILTITVNERENSGFITNIRNKAPIKRPSVVLVICSNKEYRQGMFTIYL